MISHNHPVESAVSPVPVGAACKAAIWWAPAGAKSVFESVFKSAWSAGAYGPLRVEHHLAARRQGTRLDPSFVSISADPRRFCGPLLLSGARPAGDRCGRPGAARRDRDAGGAFPALLGPAGGV